jgi:SPP1 family predicted phage head-tail adaptor
MGIAKIGKFRHRVEIQSYSQAADAEGQIARSWSTAATVWGRVNPISGNERVAADQIKSKLSHRITIRKYEGTWTGQMRIKYDGKFFNIISIVDPDYRGCFEIIDCAINEKQTA